MHTPSETQQRILTAAVKEPTADIRTFMAELKSPAIRNKVLQSMIKHGYVTEQPLAGAHPEKGEKIYTITEAGMAITFGAWLSLQPTPQTQPAD